jgi:NhaA family Na+:H+ antiporter
MREVQAEGSHLHRQVLLPAERFIYSETISGALLLLCAIAALAWANSPWSSAYFALRDTPVSFQVGGSSLALDLQHWINDGLMAIFFFVVALEIKRELVFGDLSDRRKAALPVAAALGGMILPAGIYLALNFGGKGVMGWGIPMATDIAFAVAILALLGGRVPSQLRIFLLTFAIADDVGSILVIAIYYTAHFSLPAMGLAIAVLGLILAMRWLGFRSTLAYVLPSVVFWGAMHQSGVHATIAGVILGAITPAESRGSKAVSSKRYGKPCRTCVTRWTGKTPSGMKSCLGALRNWPAKQNHRWSGWSEWFIRGRVTWFCRCSPWSMQAWRFPQTLCGRRSPVR